MNDSLVVLRSVENRNLDDITFDILERCRWKEIVHPGARIVIKPNIGAAQREYLHSNTSLPVIESVCRHLLTRTSSVVIGEADGMRHTAEQALEAMGVYEMGNRLCVDVVSFSRNRLIDVPNNTLGSWVLSQTLLEADVLITMPILKTHPRTVITGALKNLWGCIPQKDRIMLHKHLARLLVDLLAVLKPRIAIMDAILAMEGRGPNNGRSIRLNLLLGSTDAVALDATAMRLVGLDPYYSSPCVLAAHEGLGKIDENEITLDGDFARFKTQFEAGQMDWAMQLLDLLSSSRFLTHHMILNDRVFYLGRKVVQLVRSISERQKRKVRPAI